MPYRDRALVERWLDEFWQTHSLFGERLRVLDDGFTPGVNSGLVVASLHQSPGLTYLSVKVVDGHPRWMVTFEPRPGALDLDADGVQQLGREIGALGALCEYLQERTDEAIQTSAAR
jgi:hypothetical protein